MSENSPLLGAHMSIAGGTPLAVARASQLGCTVLQIFVKNCNQWKGKPLLEEEVNNFRNACVNSGIREVVAHDTYLINLASPENELWQRSVEALLEELDRSERLGLSYLVIHPGSHRGAGEKEGIKRIAKAINRIHGKTRGRGVRIALETTAGQGTSIGYRFEHMRDILASCRHPEKVFVCMDTCHIFAAGYDIRERPAYLKTVEEFDRVVGLGKLKVFHFNDSKRELGSRVDRHHHIGKGKIGISGFQSILNDVRFREIPKILETPKGKTLRADRWNLKVLRSLVREEGGV